MLDIGYEQKLGGKAARIYTAEDTNTANGQ